MFVSPVKSRDGFRVRKAISAAVALGRLMAGKRGVGCRLFTMFRVTAFWDLEEIGWKEEVGGFGARAVMSDNGCRKRGEIFEVWTNRLSFVGGERGRG